MNVYLSPYVEGPKKVIKSFVPELRSRKCFSSFEIPMFYVICIYEHSMYICYVLTRPKMPFKVMHRKDVTHSNGSYERKSRGRKWADEMGRGKKKPIILSKTDAPEESDL